MKPFFARSEEQKKRKRTISRILSLNTASIPILFSGPNTDRKYSVFWRFLSSVSELLALTHLSLISQFQAQPCLGVRKHVGKVRMRWMEGQGSSVGWGRGHPCGVGVISLDIDQMIVASGQWTVDDDSAR